MPPRSEASGPDLAGGKFAAGHGRPEHAGGMCRTGRPAAVAADASIVRQSTTRRCLTSPEEIQGRKAAMPPRDSCELSRQLGSAARRHIGRERKRRGLSHPEMLEGMGRSVAEAAGARDQTTLGPAGAESGPGRASPVKAQGAAGFGLDSRCARLPKHGVSTFSLIRQPSPGTCLQPAREIGGNRDSCSMTKDAWPKVVRGQSFRRVISGC